MNGRIGKEQVFESEIILGDSNESFNNQRNSKDTLINANGRKLLELFDYHGLVVLNGRTSGDSDGEYTFISSKGCSVIDLATASINCLQIINNFKVIDFPGSDHLPIECSIRVGGSVAVGGEGAKLLPLLPKLRWSESEKSRYADRVGQALTRLQLTDDNQANVNNVVTCIVESANCKQAPKNNKDLKFKQDWFDYECLSARKRVFRLLSLFRKTNSNIVRNKYLHEQKNYKTLCAVKKENYTVSVISNLNQSTDSKLFWKTINNFKYKETKRVGNISNNEWIEHFTQLLNPPLFAAKISFAYPNIVNDSLDREFTLLDLDKVLKNVKADKAPGFDRVPYEFYKNAPTIMKEKLITIYNNILRTGRVPDSFKRSIIFPLHKKGDCNDVKNYRGLSFIDCVGKLFLSLVNQRIYTWANENNVLTEFQAGFRKGYSTIDNIFCLSNIIHLKLSKKEKLFCMFVDFSSAFDTIDRDSLVYKLSCMGVSSKIVKLLNNYYDGTTAGVWCEGGVTDSFETRMGLRQGCILSPLMFSLFLNDVPERVEGGCSLGQTRINMLMYADDLVMMSPTAAGLQHMINRLEKYCDDWNLVVNLNKSKIIVFRRGGKLNSDYKWWFKGGRIEVVNSYKYLGVTFTTTLSWEKHFIEKSRTAKTAMNVMWGRLINNPKVSLGAKFRCFESIIKAILCYGAQVWGFLYSTNVESVQRDFMKKLFRLPNNTPHYVIYLETNIEKIWLYTMTINLSYLIKALTWQRDRLPYLLSEQIIEKNIFWSKEWKEVGHRLGINIDFREQDLGRLRTQLMSVVEGVRSELRADNVGRARTSLFHQQYLTLDLELGDRGFIRDDLDVGTISWLIKARAELINLNYKPWLIDYVHTCSLCNLQQNESVFHFVAKCPVLKQIRNLHFKKLSLNYNEFNDYLNGRDWRVLGGYLKEAWKYRWQLVQEFNF